jgi:hypothetical protein
MSAPRDFSTRPRRRGLTRGESAWLLAGLAACAVAGWSTADAWAEHRDAVARLGQASAEADGLRDRLQGLRRAGGGDALAAQAALSAEAPPERVIGAVAALLPEDVRLESASLAYRQDLQVELQVAARRPAAFDELLERLQRAPSFADVLPGDEDRTGEMRAVIRGRYVPEAR